MEQKGTDVATALGARLYDREVWTSPSSRNKEHQDNHSTLQIRNITLLFFKTIITVFKMNMVCINTASAASWLRLLSCPEGPLCRSEELKTSRAATNISHKVPRFELRFFYGLQFNHGAPQFSFDPGSSKRKGQFKSPQKPQLLF